ncbi:MAG: hypothetical protein ATN31_00630 [Candidatus Epulonipiscioides saccharophilum]|nr:MAG: hypothetical protein ATN31_00630 [Epulopiscium sp. AS2M-Bin001]
MKKLMKFALITATLLGSVTSVMAIPTMPVPTMSFEHNIGWKITGTAVSSEIVSTGVTHGKRALEVTSNVRQKDWNNIAKLHVNPFPGTLWQVPAGYNLSASVTNENDYDLQIRWNITDAYNNTRMCYFTIPKNSTSDLVIDDVRFGKPGVANTLWSGNGYAQKGINRTFIKSMYFYVSEPEVAVMAGVKSPSYIIDNITLVPAK